MAIKNIVENVVVPEIPKTIDNEQIHVYLPLASYDGYGIVKLSESCFDITPEGVTIKLGTNERKGIVEFDKDLFDVKDGFVRWIGPLGVDGKSAYDIAVINGFEGTEEDWLESLKFSYQDKLHVANIVIEEMSGADYQNQGTKAFIITSYNSVTGKAYIEQTDETTAQLTELQTILTSGAKDVSFLFELENAANEQGQTIFNYDFYTTIIGVDVENGALIVEAMPAQIANSGVHYCYIVGYPQFGTESIGEYASSRGYENSAQGYASQANGYNTVAVGKYAFTSGRDTQAAYAARAGGSKCKARGKYSVAEGVECESNADSAFAMGWQCKASGTGAVAMGLKSKATKEASAAFGSSEALGDYSMAVGFKNKAYGERTFVSGISTEAYGVDSISVGRMSKAYGDQSIAGGIMCTTGVDENGNIISDDWNNRTHSQISLGENCIASYSGAVAIGSYCTASYPWATAFGVNTKATNFRAFASGQGTHAAHVNSSAHGNGTKTSAENQFVVGKNNKANSEALFQVGNGTSTDNRSNAFEVLRDGTVSTPFGALVHMSSGTVSGVENGMTTIYFDVAPVLIYWNRSGNYVLENVSMNNSIAADDNSITFVNSDNRTVSYYAFTTINNRPVKSFFVRYKSGSTITGHKIIYPPTTWRDVATHSADNYNNADKYYYNRSGDDFFICVPTGTNGVDSRNWKYLVNSEGRWVRIDDVVKNETYSVSETGFYTPL